MTDDEIRGHPDDPRPVFEGDWKSASGVEKGEHSERVRQWKERNGVATGERAKREGAKGEGRMAAGDGQPERHADDLRDLQSVIDHAPLASDRIRAIEAKQRILQRREQEEREEAHGPLVELRHTLEALPPDQRVGALSALLVVGEGLSG